MKTCPICKARCFDDMEVCYGCMHQFEPEGVQGDSPGKATGPVGASHRAEGETAVLPGKPKPSHREPPRVFGALETEDAAQGTQALGEEGPGSFSGYSPGDGIVAIPWLEPIVGPLAVASLGRGYRLVVAIERE